MQKSRSGFTIVELLIVIVVIGILAAITILAYNGVQQRANNAKTFSAVQSYVKAFASYVTINNSYPISTWACLGEDYPGDKCWDNSGTYVKRANVTTAFKSVIDGKLPMPSIVGKPYSGIMYISKGYYSYTVDGQPRNMIAYAVEGSTTKCAVGPVLKYNGGVSFSSTPPASGQTVTGTAPACWIALPEL